MQVVTSAATAPVPGRTDGRIDASVAGDIARWLRGQTDAENVRVTTFERLPGGAIQDNWMLDVEIEGGPWQGTHGFVLRTDALSGVSASLSRAQEYAVLRVAHAAGVITPEPVFLCSDLDVIGRVFFIMRRIRGIAAGHRLTREPLLVPDGDALAESLGANLARIHAIGPPRSALAALRAPAANHALATIVEYRAYLDSLDDSYPGLEWALRWC
jgi:aminoglycoside phosphotransferase (APT) family kinase protein